MNLRVSLIAASALLAAGALSGKCGDVAPSESKCETSAVEGKCNETPAPAAGTADTPADTSVTESSAASNPPPPSREPAKPNRKNRPAWPPPPELIA